MSDEVGSFRRYEEVDDGLGLELTRLRRVGVRLTPPRPRGERGEYAPSEEPVANLARQAEQPRDVALRVAASADESTQVELLAEADQPPILAIEAVAEESPGFEIEATEEEPPRAAA